MLFKNLRMIFTAQKNLTDPDKRLTIFRGDAGNVERYVLHDNDKTDEEIIGIFDTFDAALNAMILKIKFSCMEEFENDDSKSYKSPENCREFLETFEEREYLLTLLGHSSERREHPAAGLTVEVGNPEKAVEHSLALTTDLIKNLRLHALNSLKTYDIITLSNLKGARYLMSVLKVSLMNTLTALMPKTVSSEINSDNYMNGCGCTGNCGQSCSGGCEAGCEGNCGRSCPGGAS